MICFSFTDKFYLDCNSPNIQNMNYINNYAFDFNLQNVNYLNYYLIYLSILLSWITLKKIYSGNLLFENNCLDLRANEFDCCVFFFNSKTINFVILDSLNDSIIT